MKLGTHSQVDLLVILLPCESLVVSYELDIRFTRFLLNYKRLWKIPSQTGYQAS